MPATRKNEAKRKHRLLGFTENNRWVLYYTFSSFYYFSELTLFIIQQLADTHFNELAAANNTRLHNTNDNEQSSFINNLRKPQVFKPLVILFFLFFLQQASGGYVLIFYTLNIFRNLGADFLKSIDERMALVLVGSIRLVMAILSAGLAQKCNRKTLLYVSTVGMGVFAWIASSQMLHVDDTAHSLFLRHDVNVSVAPYDSTISSASNYLLLFCILGYMLFASLGILIVPWTLISELYTIKYKATFGGASVAIAYVLMSIVLKVFPFALEAFSISVIFAIFGAMSFVCGVFIYFCLPETHRKTFGEIEEYFVGRKE